MGKCIKYFINEISHLKKGDTLVVLGASGSTGIAAIQIGKIMGAKVIAASSSIEKQNYTTDRSTVVA